MITSKTFRNYLAAPAVTFVFFNLLGLVTWKVDGNPFTAINYFSIGFFATLGMVLFATLPKKKKLLGRRISFVMIGLGLFLGAGVMGRLDMQLEGFFFYLLAGVTAGTVSHYLVAKILGPLLLGRGWCGWGCWTMTVLDFFPYRRSSGRVPGKWGWLRYAHFALSLGLVLMLGLGFGYALLRHKWDILGMYWYLAGNAVYYAVGIALTIGLRDNRAFCKYVCPVTVFLKLSSSFSLLRIKGDNGACKTCKACTTACPMDIAIPEYTQAGRRVTSNECILCLNCIEACPNGALSVSLGLDFGGKGRYRERKAQVQPAL